MRQTSLEAYKSIVPDLGMKQAAVLGAIISLERCTDKEIAAALNWSINRVTPRRGELLEKGLIEEAGVVINEFNRPATTWRFKRRMGNQQIDLFA